MAMEAERSKVARKPDLPIAGESGPDLGRGRAREVAAAAKPGGAARGRLLFALDATASREPTWDAATAQQGEMFVAAGEVGGLEVRLAFYRGFDEFKVSRWTTTAANWPA